MKTVYLLRIATWLSKFVPKRTAYRLCSLIGSVLFYLKPEIRHAVMDNLSHVVPKASVRRRRLLARRVVRNTVKNYYDLVRLPNLTRKDIERDVAVYGEENLRNAVALGKGVILVSGHIGNFQIVAQIAAIHGYNVAAVAEDIHPEKLYDYMNFLRGQLGLRFIRTGSSQVRTIYKFVRGGGVLMLAADRDVTDAGIPMDFFDAPADLPAGPVVLALRLNATLLPAYTLRLRDNTSSVKIYPPIELERTGNRDQDVRANLRKVAQSLESAIRTAPDQWLPLQRVWDREISPSSDAPVQAPPDGKEEVVAAQGANGTASEASPNGTSHSQREPLALPLEKIHSVQEVKSEEPSPSSVS